VPRPPRVGSDRCRRAREAIQLAKPPRLRRCYIGDITGLHAFTILSWASNRPTKPEGSPELITRENLDGFLVC
jgi:hypothetical protein